MGSIPLEVGGTLPPESFPGNDKLHYDVEIYWSQISRYFATDWNIHSDRHYVIFNHEIENIIG